MKLLEDFLKREWIIGGQGWWKKACKMVMYNEKLIKWDKKSCIKQSTRITYQKAGKMNK